MQIKTEKNLLAGRQEHIRQLAFESMSETLKNWGMLEEAADRFSAKLREAGIMPDIDLSKESFKNDQRK